MEHLPSREQASRGYDVDGFPTIGEGEAYSRGPDHALIVSRRCSQTKVTEFLWEECPRCGTPIEIRLGDRWSPTSSFLDDSEEVRHMPSDEIPDVLAAEDVPKHRRRKGGGITVASGSGGQGE